MNNLKVGYLYVTGAAVLWALCGVASKFLFNNGITPFELVQLRLTLTALILFGGLALFSPSHLRISLRDILYFVIIGTAGLAAVQSSYFYAISKINVAAAILLQYLAPVFITAYSVFFLRERVRTSTLLALTGTIGGCYLLVGGYNLNLLSMNKAGILGGLLSAVTFAFFTYQGEYGMRKYSPLTVLFYSFFFGSITWNILCPPFSGFTRGNSPNEWAWVAFIALPGTVAPFILYLQGIKRIRSIKAGITATLEPIAAALISFLFLHETMELPQVAGGMVVIASVILLQCSQEEAESSGHVAGDVLP